MVALRGKEESFNVGPDPLEKFFERRGLRPAGDPVLLVKYFLGVTEIVGLAKPLEDEIEAVDRSTGGRKKLRDCVEAGGEDVRGDVFKD
jgi:hypothetical protein